MKVLLLSDNHGYWDEGILKHVQWADEVWHAGDWLNLALHDQIFKLGKPIRGVFGNVDGTDVKGWYKLHNKFTIEGVKFWMTHIGGKPGKYNPKILNSLKNNAPDVFICGHSHILMVKKDPTLNFLYMNPGSCGLQGFHQVRTAIRFQIVNSQLTALEIVEWEKKCMNFDLYT